jgi:hypothetical protein
VREAECNAPMKSGDGVFRSASLTLLGFLWSCRGFEAGVGGGS